MFLENSYIKPRTQMKINFRLISKVCVKKQPEVQVGNFKFEFPFGSTQLKRNANGIFGICRLLQGWLQQTLETLSVTSTLNS